ncbi:MAG: alpha-L-arabinofuranosidase C-terminal domain-containing protein [Tepidisphaeraceae bacterium]
MAGLSVHARAFGAAAPTTLHVEPDRAGPALNPRMYGVFLEEINTAIDGGLYAEMIRNRGFEESKPPEGFTHRGGRWVNPGGYATDFFFKADEELPYWNLIADGGAQATLSLDVHGDLNVATPRAAKLEVREIGTRAGLATKGYWGLGLRAGEQYRLTFWVRSDRAYGGKVSAIFEGASGKPIGAVQRTSSPIGTKWHREELILTASADEPKARLVISADQPGTLWFDMVSLFPVRTFKDWPNGMRRDIAQMVADLKPGFVRFPGGCVVEGATHETAYDWKKTLGPIEQREEAWNVWDYRRTHGVGFFEYLQFIEDIGAEPMFVSSAGQTCIFRGNTTPVPMAQMQPLAQNFLDALEYANGDAATPWGKRRIEAGHEKPFGMKMLEVGNENVGDEYLDRYAFIYPQIKAKAPDTLVLANIPSPTVKTEMVDEHYYSSPNWFVSNEHFYDDRPRSDPPIYIAELAVTTDDAGKDRGNLRAALAEGVFLMGCERNGDHVRMVSYAPLLANVNGRTGLAGAPPPWHGMIYFDNSRVFGTASYYLWKTFAENLPSRTVATRVESADDQASVAGAVGVGTWGTTAEFKDVRVERGGQVVYASDFSKPDAAWHVRSGDWQTVDGVYRQARPAVAFATIGNAEWSDYTLTLKARKLAGNEGFLILFGYGTENRLWWNLGGWGNQEHGIEFNQNPVGPRVKGTIETGRWYDVKVELRGRSVKCYLDGKLINEGTVPVTPRLHANAGIDQATGDLILKVINTSAAPRTAQVDVGGSAFASGAVRVTRLTSAAPLDNNSLDEPHKVTPTQSIGPSLAEQPTWEFPAHSLTVLRVSGKK